MADKLIDVLMRRDSITRNEAIEVVREAYYEYSCGDNPFQIEEMLHHDLGLEPDFIEDVAELAEEFDW